MARTRSTPTAPATSVNEVTLVGRLSAPVTELALPSGDALWTWRLIVDRPPGERGARVDTIDCVTYSTRIGRRSHTWPEGAVLEIAGRLRRRFFRSAGRAASRYEVECLAVRRSAGAEKSARSIKGWNATGAGP